MKKYIYRLVLIVSFFFVTGFGGCNLLDLLFSLYNTGSPDYNDMVVEAQYRQWYVADEGIIYTYEPEADTLWKINYVVPGKPDLLDVTIYGGELLTVGTNGTIVYRFISSWDEQNSNVDVTLNKILWTDREGSDRGFIVGDSGTVLRSNESVLFGHWNKLDFPTTDNLYEIAENGDTIFVSGENYCFYKSTDDGETWIPTGPGKLSKSGFLSSYNRIYFYDENIGYVGGPNGLILKTTNGGRNWTTKVASDFSEVNDLHFISPDSGAAVGPDGVVRLTTDGGDSWFEDDSLTSFLNGTTIKRIVAQGKYYGFVIGESGFNLFVAKDSTYLDSIGVTTKVEEDIQLPEEFTLYQNYPNPFNPSTKIRFNVDETQRTELGVYNILGERVTTLFNDVAFKGKYYEVEFDAGKFASGIYLGVLQSKSKKETIKMLLMK